MTTFDLLVFIFHMLLIIGAGKFSSLCFFGVKKLSTECIFTVFVLDLFFAIIVYYNGFSIDFVIDILAAYLVVSPIILFSFVRKKFLGLFLGNIFAVCFMVALYIHLTGWNQGEAILPNTSIEIRQKKEA